MREKSISSMWLGLRYDLAKQKLINSVGDEVPDFYSSVLGKTYVALTI